MQSKGAIKLLAVLLALACIYQLSFTLKTYSVEKKAVEYAQQFPDAEQAKMERHYLDSIANKVVYNLGVVKFTYKECKEKELNLGLDLKGGMNVMLEIQAEDVLKSLAGDKWQENDDFKSAIAAARSEDDLKEYVEVFADNYGGSLAELFIASDRVSGGMSNNEVKSVLKDEVEEAVDASENIIRSRIDHLGVTQPNIQRVPGSNRILVELPGIKEPERVRKLLTGTASLEFWETYNAANLQANFARAEAKIRELEAAKKAATKEETAEAVKEETPAEEATELEKKAAEAANNAEQQAIEMNLENYPLTARLQIVGAGPIVGYAEKHNTTFITNYLMNPEVRAAAGFPADLRLKWAVKEDKNNLYALYALKAEPNGKPSLDGSVVSDARASYSAERGSHAEVTMTMNSQGITAWSDLTAENIGECIAIVLDGYVYSAPVVNQRIDGGNSSITGDFSIKEAQDLANVLKSGKVRASARIIQEAVVGPSLGQESINAGLLSFLIAFILVLLYMGLFYKTAGWMSAIALVANIFFLLGILVSFGAVLTLPGIAGIVLTMGMAVDANVIIFERIKEELRSGKGIAAAIKDGFSNAYSAIIDGNLTTIITGIVLFAFGVGPVKGFATTLVIGIITSLFCSIFITRLLIEWIVAKRGKISFSRKWSENWLSNVRFDFVGKRVYAYIFSGVIILAGALSLVFHGLNKGVEFTGGRTYVVRFDQKVSADAVREALDKAFENVEDVANASFEVKQYGNDRQMRVVTQYKHNDTSNEANAHIDSLLWNNLKGLYAEEIGFTEFTESRNETKEVSTEAVVDKNDAGYIAPVVDTTTEISTGSDSDETALGIISAEKIGSAIAKDMTKGAILSIVFALLAIALYITLRFKKWQWAMGATAALVHDAFLVIGAFSLFYTIMPFNLEVNQAFIAAILTIIGYSINDTVVIFDRVREYITLYPKRNVKETMNNALCSTLARTVNTSGTTLVTLLAIFIFGGETIRGFVFALLVGVIVGTYSSLFVAAPLSYDMMSKTAKKGESK